MHYGFPSSEIPLVYTQRQGLEYEDKDVEADKAEPCYDQPVCNINQQTVIF
jgi:hypothetical protein